MKNNKQQTSLLKWQMINLLQIVLPTLVFIILSASAAQAQTPDSFNPSPDLPGTVNTIAIQPDGKILVGGAFTTIGGQTRNRIARLNTDGSADTGFNPNANDQVFSLTQQVDGKILVAGRFTTIGGQTRNRIARLNSDGSLDSSFNPNANNEIDAVVVQADGKILVGGNFTGIGGQTRNSVARLNADGSLDAAFNPNPTSGSFLTALAIQPDGKILVGGGFTTIGGQSRNRIARLNSDGSLDNLFDPNSNNFVTLLKLQPDGKILVGGNFTNIGGQPRNSLARLNSDGSLDTSFINPTVNQTVYSLVMQADGKILIGGFFTAVGGQTRSYVARLNSDGTLDGNYNANVSSVAGFTVSVYAIALQTDGRLVVSGQFETVGGQARRHITRLTNDTAAVQTLSATSSIITLSRSGSAPELSSATFERSNDNGATYTFLGNGTRVGTTSSFELSGLSLTVGSSVFIRARGYYSTGIYNGSGSITELAQNVLVTSSTVSRPHPFDFDGDGRDDVAVFRPADFNWYLNRSTQGITQTPFGIANDKITPADFDGDGKTDLAVFRNGIWYLLRSTLGFAAIQWGSAGDVAVPADFDGDGKVDLAVFRNGIWFVLNSGGGVTSVQWGTTGDVPLPADYDGDGKAEFAVWRTGAPTVAAFFILNNQSNTVRTERFGQTGDIPMAADFDGDGKSDVATYRAGGQSIFFYRGSLNNANGNVTSLPWGTTGDIPAPADFDGDGKTDAAVFRNGVWFIQRTSAGVQVLNFGLTGDKPIPNAYLP